MPKKKKTALSEYQYLKDIELKIIHLKTMLEPSNSSIPLFQTEFNASGLIPLVLGSEVEKEVTGDVIAFFSELDAKYKKRLTAEYKKITAQMLMRIVDYDVSVEGRDEDLNLIEYEEVPLIDNGDGTFTDEVGNLCEEDGEIIEKVQTVKEAE